MSEKDIIKEWFRKIGKNEYNQGCKPFTRVFWSEVHDLIELLEEREKK